MTREPAPTDSSRLLQSRAEGGCGIAEISLGIDAFIETSGKKEEANCAKDGTRSSPSSKLGVGSVLIFLEVLLVAAGMMVGRGSLRRRGKRRADGGRIKERRPKFKSR
jgi:hypothetical protein